MHGYDVVDHNCLNPETGYTADFEQFVATLRAHDMGHIVDFVPNHVGIMGADNAWWMDVLENGKASRYGEFFDIDWSPPNPALADKLLVPVLGGPYGSVLEAGELRLEYEAASRIVRGVLPRAPLSAGSRAPIRWSWSGAGARVDASRAGTAASRARKSRGGLPQAACREIAARRRSSASGERDKELHKRAWPGWLPAAPRCRMR